MVFRDLIKLIAGEDVTDEEILSAIPKASEKLCRILQLSDSKKEDIVRTEYIAHLISEQIHITRCEKFIRSDYNKKRHVAEANAPKYNNIIA